MECLEVRNGLVEGCESSNSTNKRLKVGLVLVSENVVCRCVEVVVSGSNKSKDASASLESGPSWVDICSFQSTGDRTLLYNRYLTRMPSSVAKKRPS